MANNSVDVSHCHQTCGRQNRVSSVPDNIGAPSAYPMHSQRRPYLNRWYRILAYSPARIIPSTRIYNYCRFRPFRSFYITADLAMVECKGVEVGIAQNAPQASPYRLNREMAYKNRQHDPVEHLSEFLVQRNKSLIQQHRPSMICRPISS
jgi:hypothetical protein